MQIPRCDWQPRPCRIGPTLISKKKKKKKKKNQKQVILNCFFLMLIGIDNLSLINALVNFWWQRH